MLRPSLAICISDTMYVRHKVGPYCRSSKQQFLPALSLTILVQEESQEDCDEVERDCLVGHFGGYNLG